jgi:glutamate/tyrosine decarboxylase-like PLP-dependent enzyme
VRQDPDLEELLAETARLASGFLGSLEERAVRAEATVDELREALGGPLPEGPTPDLEVVRELAAAAEPGIVAIPSGRYFGFVIGSAVPASLAADWLTSTWDQNAGLYVAGPSAAVVEEICIQWLAELLGLPEGVSGAFVTGCQMAHVTALAAARHSVLERVGWDVRRDGLIGAPPIRVLAGSYRHVTFDRALRLLGLGDACVRVIESDDGARMRADELARALGEADGPTIVCAKAGEVNTGAFDPLEEIADLCEQHGAWLHVDGAFGLWAAASPELRHLTAGAERADSWATDAHKWLNVPYDSGIAFCRHPDAHRAAMGVTASYLIHSETGERDAVDWTPEFSRRARGFAIYAAIRSLGRSGVADLVERSCAYARRFAELLGSSPELELLNDVVSNQVLFRVAGEDGDERTRRAVALIQQDGVAWMSGTRWRGRQAIRISVSNYRTDEADVDATFESILSAVAGS